jgi:hypothetical protein
MHDDLQVMRQLEMEKCFLDGQIPCRWVPDMGYGFGYPLFNYYPPLPYLIGEAIRLIGYSFIDTVKILFILSFVASGISMYFFAKEFFGRFGALVSAVFYVWAPYHAVDVYVRGAMNEAWALIWFPAILWASYRLIKEKQKAIVSSCLLALFWFGLFTSHNLMVLIFGPLFAVWCLIFVIKFKALKKIPYLILSGMWAFGLAAFFSLPVFLEKGIVQTNTLVIGYYEYTAHFVNISQLLISRFWGYGPSVWDVINDKMSFQIGWIHWAISLIAIFMVGVEFLRRKKIDVLTLVIVYFFVFGWLAAFMTHSRSTPIWQALKPLEFVQFPWRFLTIVTLCFSFLAGYIVKETVKLVSLFVGIGLIIAVLVYSWAYFLPEHGKLGPITDQEKLSGVAWEMQQTAGIYDYLPKTAKTAAKAPRKELVEFISGDGKILSESLGTNWMKFSVDLKEESELRINILDFPNWRAFKNGSEVEIFVPESEEWGRMHVKLTEGVSNVSLKLYDTPVRTLGNFLSLVSWSALIVLILRLKSK